MSAKVKLISFISAFVLVLGIMIIGVLSAEQVQVNIGGSVSFNATNVYAKVSGNISRAETGNKTFSTLTYSASETTGDESDWTNLALEFTETPDPIIITITVENLSTQRTLTVNLENTLQGEGLDIAVTRDSGSYTSGTNVELPVSTGDSSSTTTFTLTLTVANPDQSLTDVSFGYILNMYDESSVPVDLSAFTFTTSGSNATLTSYTGTDAEVVIPSTISLTPDGAAIEGSDYTVTAIAAGTSLSGPFYSARSTLKSITIPETIETIGNYAFYNCTALTEINYNATNVSDLSSGNRVFYDAGQGGDGITVNIGANVTRLPNYIFNPYSNSFHVPEITTVNFAEGSVCESIGSNAFQYCDSLTSITIPENVTSIGNYAFAYCYGLIEINYNATAANILSYENYVFSDAGQGGDGITVNIGANVTKLPNYIFAPDLSSSYSPNITTVNFEEGSVCESISGGAFNHCLSLTSITIPSSVTSIGTDAFAGCYALAEIYNYSSLTIPQGTSDSSVGNLGRYAKVVYNADDLTGEKPETRITVVDNVQYYSYDKDFIALAPISRNVTGVTLDNRTTEIQPGAFCFCDNINFITIPERVTSIGDSTFRQCGLDVIAIPDNVTSIGDYAFSGCVTLARVNFGDNSQLTSISDSAFSRCGNLTSITIPSSVTSIGDWAFSSCSRLTRITINATTPPTLGSNAIPSNVTKIYVPAESVEAYKEANGWSRYKSKISAIVNN